MSVRRLSILTKIRGDQSRCADAAKVKFPTFSPWGNSSSLYCASTIGIKSSLDSTETTGRICPALQHHVLSPFGLIDITWYYGMFTAFLRTERHILSAAWTTYSNADFQAVLFWNVSVWEPYWKILGLSRLLARKDNSPVVVETEVCIRTLQLGRSISDFGRSCLLADAT